MQLRHSEFLMREQALRPGTFQVPSARQGPWRLFLERPLGTGRDGPKLLPGACGLGKGRPG